MDSLSFIIGVILMLLSYIISVVTERKETLEFKYCLILKTVSDGMMFFGMVLIFVSYGIFLYENVR